MFSNENAKDIGLLIIRLGIGASMLIFHGQEKLTGGPEVWVKIGGSMKMLGIIFLPVFWGFMAALAESIGSVLIMLGILFRPATAILAFTMLIAVLTHMNLSSWAFRPDWKSASHAIEFLVIYTGLFLIGPGRFGVTFKK
ncbi:MAG TPA: DoxX family protein [Nitrospirae bacterium]|nr:doxX [bacterium BMS3Bbin09]HDH01449.1 DoxX family protein [Nitrospirota bacterium]